MRRRVLHLTGLLSLGVTSALAAQEWPRGDLYAPRGSPEDTIAPPLAREFRAAWLATVSNIDWPSRPGLSSDEQKAELVRLFDIAKRVRLNAIILQVRPSADALYPSSIEPWSYFLTGAMGQPPVPYYDPLAFAVREAHARGLELHAWFNPYRSRHPADRGRAAASHVSRRAPAWDKRYGAFGWMDPGEPGVRRQTLRVILDVVRRYDIDGVHLDDYFYPYPERTRRGREIDFPDGRSWNAYRKRGGTLSRDDWRRKNVDDLIEELYTAVKGEKPWVKVGISPFGIWRPGFPSGVQGFDAFEKLFADSRRWLREGWVDYFTPQLYWRLSAPQQPYGELLAWWRGENVLGRHMWPGNYTGRASAERSVTWPTREIFLQIQETRAQLGLTSGNVHFPLNAFVFDTDSLVERLEAGPYAEPALVPAATWLQTGEIATPRAQSSARAEGTEVTVLDPVAVAASPNDRQRKGTAASPRWYLIRALYADGWRAQLVDASVRTIRLAAEPLTQGPTAITLSAIDRVGRESMPWRPPQATNGSGR